MKKLIYISILAFLSIGYSNVAAQERPKEYLGLPGDNLNLYAVLDIFQNAETLEAFERRLNDPEQMVNNLDLNNDNYVDYIMVLDYAEEDLHNIVLRVALNENEYQDVAVIVVEKFPNGSVQIQLIGDEALYGQNYIVEPVYAETVNPGYRGNSNTYSAESGYDGPVVSTTFYEVSQWPVIVYVYSPYYRPWRSSWRWAHYPDYWNPWHPHYWHYYYGYHSHWHPHYYAHYRHWNHHRCNRYNSVYYSRVRRSSSTVVVNVNNGRYKGTYTRPETRSAGEKIASQRVSERKRVNSGTASVNNTARKQDRTKVDNTTRVSNRNNGNASVSTPIRRIDNTRRGSTTKTSRVSDRSNSRQKEASGNVYSGRSSNQSKSSGRDVRSSSRRTNSTSTANPSTRQTTNNNVSRSTSSGRNNKSAGSSQSVSRSNRSSSSSSVKQSKPSQSNRSSSKVSSTRSSSSKSSSTKNESKSSSKGNSSSRSRNK